MSPAADVFTPSTGREGRWAGLKGSALARRALRGLGAAVAAAAERHASRLSGLLSDRHDVVGLDTIRRAAAGTAALRGGEGASSEPGGLAAGSAGGVAVARLMPRAVAPAAQRAARQARPRTHGSGHGVEHGQVTTHAERDVEQRVGIERREPAQPPRRV
jgi:hypothetical protein